MSTFLGFGLINISTVRGLTFDLQDRGPTYSGFTPLSVVPGGTNMSIWCDIQYWGIGLSGDFNVSFRVSLDTTINLADPEIAKVLVPSIFAGDWADVLWYGTFPKGITNETYYVGWIIDIDEDVFENDEANNNIYETPSQLEVVIEAELYDRGLSYSGFTPTEVMPGVTQFSIWCDIENVGLAPSGPFNLSFLASFNPSVSLALDFEIARVTVPSIMNGSYADVSWTGTFPYIPFSGYYVGWEFDIDDDVDEGSEYNVGYASFYPLSVVNKSDLTDRGASYSGMSEMSVEPGVTTFSVFADIENIGLMTSEASNVSFYASLDTNITTSDYYLGYDDLLPLLNGSYSDVTWAGIFPNISDGSYYIGWISDVNDDVDEGNEGNNQAHLSTQLIVDSAAPTSLISFTPIAGPYTVDTSTEFTITSDDGSGSGIDEISYRVDGGTWNEYTTPFTLSGYASGNHTIEYFAVDNLGNTESIESVDVYIQPPSSGIPGYEPLIIIGILTVTSIVFLISKRKKNKL